MSALEQDTRSRIKTFISVGRIVIWHRLLDPPGLRPAHVGSAAGHQDPGRNHRRGLDGHRPRLSRSSPLSAGVRPGHHPPRRLLAPGALRVMRGAKLRALKRADADAQKAVTRCAHCRWYYRGSVFDGKQAFRSHVEREHGRAA